MAMTVTYLTINGEIISETRSGVRADYLPDALGSTIALTNSSNTITDNGCLGNCISDKNLGVYPG